MSPFLAAGIIVAEGFWAWQDGYIRESDPYETDSFESATWLMGWDEGELEDWKAR